MKKIYTVISATGSYIPTEKVHNRDFLKHEFFDSYDNKINKDNEEILDKFEKITGITERRYVTDNLVSSDIAYYAAKDALESTNIDKESLDYIIFAHNFGDVKADNKKTDLVPTLAARVKHRLKIKNPKTIPYDLPFGCPGWLQGMIQADYYIKSGDAKRIMVIGAETLSRITDPHDRDSMLYSDGAGATIIEAETSEEPVGILSHSTRSDTLDEAYMLWMGKSYNSEHDESELYLKMHGRKLYEYALKTVPQVVEESIEKAGLTLNDVHKVLIHQANEKMDEAILKRLYALYGKDKVAQNVMPMSISWLGNSSVATVPTLLDLLYKAKLGDHISNAGNILVFASVGAGMNINSMVYKIP